jgi:hypothetical protein
MRLRGFITLTFGLLLFSGVGCGLSPLLNHVNEDELAKPDSGLGRLVFDHELSFASLGASARLKWLDGPHSPNESKLAVEIVGADADSVEVVLWMPEMGHGSADTVVTRAGTTKFEVTDIYFIMSGLWELQVRLKTPDGRKEEAVWSITIP